MNKKKNIRGGDNNYDNVFLKFEHQVQNPDSGGAFGHSDTAARN